MKYYIDKIAAVHSIIAKNQAMLNVAEKRYNSLSGRETLFFDKKEMLENIEKRRAIDLRLRNYLKKLTIQLSETAERVERARIMERNVFRMIERNEECDSEIMELCKFCA